MDVRMIGRIWVKENGNVWVFDQDGNPIEQYYDKSWDWVQDQVTAAAPDVRVEHEGVDDWDSCPRYQ